MKPFSPIELTPGYWLDSDTRNYILAKDHPSRTVRDSQGREKVTKGYRETLGYYATLPGLLRGLGEYRLRTVHMDDWSRVVSEMDGIGRRLVQALGKAWVE